MSLRFLITPAGSSNRANGFQALFSNTTGDRNTATGWQVLANNPGANNNTAHGFEALHNSNSGNNTGIGFDALEANTTGNSNTAVGANALRNATGSDNIALGEGAGGAVLAGNNNIEIGNGGASAGDFPLQDDKTNNPQFGLIAEEVARVNPALIAVDKEGKPYSVRYQQINAMLLNEFLKEHRTVQEQGATITQLKSMVEKQEAANAQQQKQIEALATGLQKVSAQLAAASSSRGGLEASRSAPQVVNNP